MAVDADANAVLGVVAAEIWTRDSASAAKRRQRGLADKESQRWLTAAQAASKRLREVAQTIVVGDRESLFARRLQHPESLVRFEHPTHDV